jgi:DNA (cytosine-5)-methyltransferase 1
VAPARVGSLFSGIGGLDLGLQRAGWEHAFLCERSWYRRAVLRERFPGVPIRDDVRWVAATEEERPDPVDLLSGGFPCQDLSVAGNQEGLAGPRSRLFFEFARVADRLRPSRLLIENVPGLFSSEGGRDFGVVLGVLADLGYGLGWRVLDSRFFGVPQRRRRVFIVGVRADGDPRTAAERAGQILAVSQRCDRHPAPFEPAAQVYRGTAIAGIGGSSAGHDDAQSGRLIVGERGVRRLLPVEYERAQGFPDGWTMLRRTGDERRIRALRDAVTVGVAEWVGARLRASLTERGGVGYSAVSGAALS